MAKADATPYRRGWASTAGHHFSSRHWQGIVGVADSSRQDGHKAVGLQQLRIAQPAIAVQDLASLANGLLCIITIRSWAIGRAGSQADKADCKVLIADASVMGTQVVWTLSTVIVAAAEIWSPILPVSLQPSSSTRHGSSRQQLVLFCGNPLV